MKNPPKFVVAFLFVLLTGFLLSCGPSKEEKALVVFCDAKVPQIIHIGSDMFGFSAEDCFYCDNYFYLNNIRVNTDYDQVELFLESTTYDYKKLSDLFKSHGQEVLFDMASSRKCILTMLKQVQLLGYSIKITVMLDEVCVFENETIKNWNLNNIIHD